MTTQPAPTVPPRPRGRRFRWVLLALFFVVVALPIVGFVRDQLVPPPDDGIAWRSDFEAALRDAQSSNRPLLVDVTASWCPPCKVMKRSTWPDARVGALVRERFVPVRLDADVPAHGAIAQRYGAAYLPTVLVLEPDGRVRDIATEYDADAMADFLTRASAAPAAHATPAAASRATTVPATLDALIAGKGEPTFALWDGGVYLLNRPKRVLFAAWPDGTVAREAGHSSRPGRVLHNAAGQTVGRETIVDQEFRVGRVPRAQVQTLLDEAAAAGFDSLGEIGWIVPDGPFQIIEIRRDGQTRSRSHDPTTRPVDVRRPSSSAEAAYVELWRRVGIAIERMRPADERPLRPATTTRSS